MGNKCKMYVGIMACNPEVTGSCFLCVLKLPDRQTIKFIVDCGLFQEEEYFCFNNDFPFECDNIDFMLLTHNHVDHTGRIPLLYKKGFRGKIYTSKTTKSLLPLALNDSYKVLSEIYKRKNLKRLYEEKDVDMALEYVEGIEFNKKTNVTPNIDITFLENGHLFGAAMILVEISYPDQQPINLLFTGDYNNKNYFFEIGDIPKEVKDLRLSVIIESTYGDMSVKEVNNDFFQKKVIQAVSERKTIILPAFSLGRSQEVLLEIKNLQDSNVLDKNIPIYFDGKLAHAYTRILLNFEIKEFLPSNLTFVDSEIRETLLNTEDTKIIVTTSGMGTYGPAQVYIPYFISKKQSLILFTGYTADGTLGQELKEAKQGDFVKIGGLVCKKNADVAYCNQFSAHAKQEELIELLNKFNNLRSVLINHGEKHKKQIFAEKVLETINVHNVAILDREYFFRIGSFGIIKSLSTKF